MSKTADLLALSSEAPSLDAFWAATMAHDAATLPIDAVCSAFADAMASGRDPSQHEWRLLSALQTERGRGVGGTPAPLAPVSAGPFLVHYEVSVGDAPGALPLRLSLPILCF